jgi:hypothetical protein
MRSQRSLLAAVTISYQECGSLQLARDLNQTVVRPYMPLVLSVKDA